MNCDNCLALAPTPSRLQACLVSAPRDERLAHPFQKERTPSCRARLMLVGGEHKGKHPWMFFAGTGAFGLFRRASAFL